MSQAPCKVKFSVWHPIEKCPSMQRRRKTKFVTHTEVEKHNSRMARGENIDPLQLGEK